MQERHELEFQVHYSILLEEMQMRLMGRLDRWCTFIQLLAGSAAFASGFASNGGATPFIVGALVAMLAGVQIVWQPAAASTKAKIQLDAYLSLLRRMPSLDDKELLDQLRSMDQFDSSIPGGLCAPAQVAACLRLDLPVDDSHFRFGAWSSLLAVCAGHLPRKA